MTAGQEDKDDMVFITDLLGKNGVMVTDDIVKAIQDHKKENASPDCNDRTMRNLISLKKSGTVNGKMNREKRTWEWSLP